MKKNIKTLIACAAALAVAGGGYAVLVLTGDDDSEKLSSGDSSVSDSASVSTPIFEFEKEDIQSVSVKNTEGEYKAVPAGGQTEDETITLTIEGFENLPLNDTLLGTLLNSSTSLNSDSTAEDNPSDISKYGLDNPAAEVTVKTSAEEKTLLVGNESPVDGETYLMEKGGSAVYLAATSSLSVFQNNPEYFISTTLLEEPAEDSYPTVEEISISRTDLDYDIVLDYDESADNEDEKSGTLATHYMTEPIFAYLDVEKSQDATHGLFGLTAQSAVSANPGDEEISAAGLKEPFCTVIMKTDEPETYTLKIGNQLESEDGKYYLVMIDGIDVIYAVSSDSLCWAELQPGDITSKMIFGTYVWDISKLEISINGGETVSFKGSGSDESDYTVTKNGDKCDSERFRSFYTFLLKTSAEEFVIDEKPEGDAVVTINLETQDGKTKQTIEFFKSDGKKALISVNGVPSFKCRMAYVDLLIENLGKFDSDEDFVMNW